MTSYTFNGTEQEKKIYAGVEFEKNLSSNTTYSYIYAGNEPIAVYIQNDSNKLYYLHSVLNGSISYITDTEGNKVDTLSYTPFGQRRLFSDWSKTDTAKHLIDRGFTGQQHLDNFALINFNGRMYDPVLAHFLSPDPYIQAPENPLNHNRYSYCLFSPLQYVDPTGLMIWHPDKNGNLVADPGDDYNTLKTYLITIYGDESKIPASEWDYFKSQIDNYLLSTGGTDLTGMQLSSEMGTFENLVGKFLVTRFNENQDWGLPENPDYHECSPTTFNRVNLATEFVYGKKMLGKFGWNNSIYSSWNGHSKDGYPTWGAPIIAHLGLGQSVNKNDFQSGLLPGAIIGLQSIYYNGGHSSIFIGYLGNSIIEWGHTGKYIRNINDSDFHSKRIVRATNFK